MHKIIKDMLDAGVRIDAWSYSRVQTFRSCKRKALLLHGGSAKSRPKIAEPESPAMERGKQVHAEAEQYLQAGGNGLALRDKVWKDWLGEVKELREHGYEPEQRFAFDKKWYPLEDYFHRTTWMRAALDAVCIDGDGAIVIDFKTGKEYPDHEEQAELYALTVFEAYPEVNDLLVEFWYLDQKHVTPYAFTRVDDHLELYEKWHAIGKEVTSETEFAPSPGKGCNAYNKPCPFSQDGELPICEYDKRGME